MSERPKRNSNKARVCAIAKITTKSSMQIECDWLLGQGVTSTYLIHFLFPSFPDCLKESRRGMWHLTWNVTQSLAILVTLWSPETRVGKIAYSVIEQVETTCMFLH